MPYFDSLLFENSLNPIKLEFWILLWEISYIINFWAWIFPWFITQHFIDISINIFFCCKKNLIGMERHWSQHKTYRWLLVGRSTTNVIGFDWIKNCTCTYFLPKTSQLPNYFLWAALQPIKTMVWSSILSFINMM